MELGICKYDESLCECRCAEEIFSSYKGLLKGNR